MEKFSGTRTLSQSCQMTLTYSNRIEGNTATLDQEESAHLLQVLRKKKGDQVMVTNGLGQGWLAEISVAHKQGAVLTLINRMEEGPGRPYGVHIALAPPKQAARLEWFLEKVTEIGVDRISILSTQRTERTRWRFDRLQRILLAAMKQSGQFRLPVLDPEDVSIQQLGQSVPGSDWEKFIPTCDWGNLPHLSSVYQPGQSVVIAIGPEGDFTPEEVRIAEEHGFHPVLLNDNRLRTETAGVVACVQIHTLNVR
ncbi:MAG: 16S rRNA (uracil(1498)-N(3))-methyltransferase [Saprospiraceae bacterium]|nr:16S rRNA (uracil(1498)-N(3))-methyltransferase [Saprospiraceae bacterium]